MIATRYEVLDFISLSEKFKRVIIDARGCANCFITKDEACYFVNSIIDDN